MASNVVRLIMGLVAVLHLLTPIAVMMYWSELPKMSQMALKAIMATLVVMEVIVVMTFCFDG